MKKILITGIILTALYIANPVSIFGKAEEAHGKGPKAVIGTVDKVTGLTLEVTDKTSNKKSNVVLDDRTQIFGKLKKQIKTNSIKIKDLVAVISTESATATPGGKMTRITKVYVKEASEAAQTKRRAVSGVISAISGNTITLTHQIQRDRTYSVVYTSQTRITMKGTKTATGADLAVGQRMTAVGDLNPAGGIIAKIIHIIPGKATGVFSKKPLITQTPAATISATPTHSATVSATPTLVLTPTVVATATPTLVP